MTVSINGTYKPSPISLSAYTLPLPPQNIEQTNATKDTITISWTPSLDVLYYTVMLYQDITGTMPLVAIPSTTTTNTITLTGLEINTDYYASFRSTSPFGSNDTDGLSNFYTIPLIVTTLRQIGGSSSSIIVNWDLVYGAISYSFYLTDSSSNSISITPFTVTSGPVTLTSDSILPNTPYSLVITSNTRHGFSRSDPYSVTSGPAPPSNITEVSATSTTITIQWQPPLVQSNITGYQVSLTDSNGTLLKQPISLGLSVLSYTYTGLMNGTYYNAIVSSVNLIGISPSLPVLVATPPNTAKHIIQTSATNVAITVDWSDASAATSYSFSLTDSSGNSITTTPSTTTAHPVILSGLTGNMVYSLIITCINDYGSTVSPATRIQTTPDPPTIFTKSGQTDTTINLEWQWVTAATSFIVSIKDTYGNTIVANQSVYSNPSIKISTLQPNTLYVLYIYSKNAIGTSIPNILNVQTTPTPPTSITQESATVSSVTFTWTGDVGAVSYNIVLQDSSGNSVRATTSSSLVSNSPITLDGLNGDTIYTLLIITKGTYFSSVSSPFSLTTAPNPPSMFTQVSATDSTMTIGWSSGIVATTYTYQLSDPSSNVIVTLTGSKNPVTLVGLQPNTVYSPVSYTHLTLPTIYSV